MGSPSSPESSYPEGPVVPGPPGPAVPGTTEILLGRVRAGERQAWDALYRRYRGLLTVVLSPRIGRRAHRRFDTDDVLQSAFLSAWRELESFTYHGKGSFSSWLRAIALHKLRDRQRFHLRHGRNAMREASSGHGLLTLIPDGSAEPSDQAEAAELQVQALEAMAELDEADQQVICLRIFDELSWEEIADRVGGDRHAARRGFTHSIERLYGRLRSPRGGAP